ncbi:MAG: GNAT family N-acetyltransferase [Pseudomonadota bacterium]
MATTLTVRTTNRADMGALDILFSLSYPALLKADYPPSALVMALPLIARVQPRLVNSGSYFCVVDGRGQIVGAGGWTWQGPQGGVSPRDMGHIRHVVTDRHLVRKGIGRALMTHIFRHAGASGVRRLDCMSTITAVPFYKAMGFSQIAEVEIQLRPGIGFPAVHMRRTLSEADLPPSNAG